MKVLLTTDRVYGYGAVQRCGDVIDVPPDEALRLIRANQAEAIEDVIETAMIEPREEVRVTRRPKHGAASH